MKFIATISTRPGDFSIAGEAWHDALAVLREEEFDGFELYPVAPVPVRPASIVFHLAQSESDYIYNWDFPWAWRKAIDL